MASFEKFVKCKLRRWPVFQMLKLKKKEINFCVTVFFLFVCFFVSATRTRRDIKMPLCLSAPVRKNLIIKIVSNDQERIQKLFWVKLVRKIEVIILSWILVRRLQNLQNSVMFSTGNNLFRQIWSQNYKLFKVRSRMLELSWMSHNVSFCSFL